VLPLGLLLSATLALVPPAPFQDAGAESAEDGTTFLGLSGGWGGARQRLEESGVTVGMSAIVELNRVLSGGLDRSCTGQALYDLTIGLDLERLAGIERGVIGFDAYVIDGHNPSFEVGDWQSFSDISAGETEQIAELYYEQGWRSLRLKLGKFDGNSEFGFPAAGGDGIHSSAVFSPTFFAMPVYPHPATGVLVGWTPRAESYVNVAVMDGAGAEGVHTGTLGPSTFFGAPSDLFWIAETGQRWSAGESELPGGIALGGWYHTGEFATSSGGTDRGTAGAYAMLDQGLPVGEESTLFLQLAGADEDVAPVDLHAGAGAVLRGLIAARPDDSFGGYATWAHFGTDPAFTETAETALEVYYRWAVLPGLALLPDLQWILDPGGDASIDDALVFTLRATVDF